MPIRGPGHIKSHRKLHEAFMSESVALVVLSVIKGKLNEYQVLDDWLRQYIFDVLEDWGN